MEPGAVPIFLPSGCDIIFDMKIIVRVMPPASAIRKLRKRFVSLLDDKFFPVMDLDSESEELRNYLELTSDVKEGTGFNPWMEFDNSELNSFPFYRPLCRGPVFSESDADYKLNYQRMESLEKISTYGDARIRLLDRVWVKSRKLKENTIAGALEWMGGFIVPELVAKNFCSAGLKGFSCKEVMDRKNQQPRSGIHLLYSESIMPPALKCVEPVKGIPFAEKAGENMAELGFSDEEAQRIGDRVDADNDPFRLYGCLCYESLEPSKLLDFNVTAEPWGGWNSPFWVVSRRVRDVYREHGLKGWVFEPVLEKGTGMFEDHQALWNNFQNQIQINPANSF
jgi:hypothetical protein